MSQISESEPTQEKRLTFSEHLRVLIRFSGKVVSHVEMQAGEDLRRAGVGFLAPRDADGQLTLLGELVRGLAVTGMAVAPQRFRMIICVGQIIAAHDKAGTVPGVALDLAETTVPIISPVTSGLKVVRFAGQAINRRNAYLNGRGQPITRIIPEAV